MSKKKENNIPVSESTSPAVENEAVEVEEPVKKPSKAARIAGTIINVVLVVAIVLAVLATYVSFTTQKGNVPEVFGVRLYSVQTPSMEPTLKQGDLVFSTTVKDAKELKVGDVITFWTTIEGKPALNTHRIVDIQNLSSDTLAFFTKGDANKVVDEKYVHQSHVVGKVPETGKDKYARIGGLGKVFDYLQDPTGFLLVVVVPVLIFLLYQLVMFFRVLFEYQNVKNRIKFEQERGANEDSQAVERERIEAELREKLRAELMAEQKQPVETPAAQEAPVEEPAEAESSETNA